MADVDTTPDDSNGQPVEEGVLAHSKQDRLGIILVVDDQRATRLVLKEYLEDRKHRVLLASSGEEAMRVAANEIPDVILLDVNLPDISGFDICRILKMDPILQYIPVLMFTGQHERKMHILSLECGALDFLEKPLDYELLEAKISSAMVFKQAVDSLRRTQLRMSMKAQAKARHLSAANQQIKDWEEESSATEQQLLLVHERLAQLMASIPSIVIGLDGNHTITHWNMMAAECFGVFPEKVSGRKLEDCNIPWDRDLIATKLQECKATGQSIRLREDVAFTRPGGYRGYLGLTISPMRSTLSGESGFLIFGADITARRLNQP